MSTEAAQNETPDAEGQPQTDSMAAFGSQMQELADALSLLYIKNNGSGRNKFRDKWPDVALYIFGEVLIQYDNVGTEDLDHRAKLEEEAGQRRVLIKDTIAELVDKSVDAGLLQFEYVGQVIDNFGAGMSTYLYAEDVIERVRPGILAKYKANVEALEAKKKEEEDSSTPPASKPTAPVSKDNAVDDTQEEDRQLSREEKGILSNSAESTIEDDVKPIETPDASADAATPKDIEAHVAPPRKIETAIDPLDDIKPIDATVPSEKKPPTKNIQPPIAPPKNIEALDPLDNIKPIDVAAPIAPPSEDKVEEKPEGNSAPAASKEESITDKSEEDSANKPTPAVLESKPATEETLQEEPVAPSEKPAAPSTVPKGTYVTMFNTLSQPKAA